MKKLSVLLMMAVMALSLAACGDKAASSSAQSVAASKPAESAASESVGTEEASSDVDLSDYLTETYMGLTDADEAVLLGFNEDASLSILAAMDAEGNYVSFVGEGVDNGDGSMTITDETNELALTFGVVNNDDGTITLTMGDLGNATVAACTIDEFMESYNTLVESGNAVA